MTNAESSEQVTGPFKETPLNVREHMDPDKHWIGESLPAPTQSEIAGTIGTVSGPGNSPFPARADHLHKIADTTIFAMTDARYINVTGDEATIYGITDPRYVNVTGDIMSSYLQIGSDPWSNYEGMRLSQEHVNSRSNNTGLANFYITRAGAAGAVGHSYIIFLRNSGGDGVGGAQIGAITINGTLNGVVYNTTSDKRLKENITDLDDTEAIQHIKKWRPVAFQWKKDEHGDTTEDGVPTGRVEHGFIAQDLYEIQPNAITPGYGTEAEHREWAKQESIDPDPYMPWMIDNSKLVPDITAALQALIRKVEDLTDRVKNLETRLDSL